MSNCKAWCEKRIIEAYYDQIGAARSKNLIFQHELFMSCIKDCEKSLKTTAFSQNK